MDFNFYMPVRVVGGSGCIAKNAALFRELGQRCLIVTGGSSAKRSGALDDVTGALQEQGIAYAIYDKVGPNPLVSSCWEAGALARKTKAEFILAIGGGSPLDAAKASAIFAANADLAPEDIYSGRYPGGALPLCVVGTTAGTGSEVTSAAVLTPDGQKIKKSIHYACCFAKIAFADPKYTFSCPYDVTVATALDAFCHAAESYFAAKADDVSRCFALKAAEMIFPEIQKLGGGELPDERGRQTLYYGSLWAGFAINSTGTGFPHAAGYPLTMEHGLPHGMACALLLPHYLRRNIPAGPNLAERWFTALGCGPEELYEILRALTKAIHIRLNRETCDRYAKGLAGRANLSNALCPITTDEVRAVYEDLFLD